ncbi:MAG: trigger factor [Eubacteriales bacterium]|nr:trigger factor [Eubacteriales bacterium]
MSKKAKILVGIVILAAVAVCAGILIWKSGYFEDSNYARLNTDKYVTLGKYKGLTYTKTKVTVTDAEVKEKIDSAVEKSATSKKVKTGTVAEGDTITISYVGKINGKTFDGGSATNSTITVGSAGFIDGFEDGLIGQKVGSKVKLNLQFPSSYYNSDVAGKKVVFTVTINSKTVKTTPTYNTAWVKKNTKYKTTAAYEKSVRASLKKEKEADAEDEAKQQLWAKAVDNSKVKSYPKKQLAYEQKLIKDQYTLQAENYGMTFKKYLKAMNLTQTKFNKQVKSYSKSVVKQKLVLYAIADKENVKVTNKEYKKYLDNLLKQAGFTESTFKSQYGMSIDEYGKQNDLKTALLLQDVLDKIMDSAKAKSAKG